MLEPSSSYLPPIARYPTDNQREASIEDQLRLCRERVQREGWQIIETYADAAISGASMIL